MRRRDEKTAALRRRVEAQHIPLIRAEEESVFATAVRDAAPKRILEIGTGVGYSAWLMAQWAPTATIVTVESMAARYLEARHNLTPLGSRVRLLYGLAEDILPRLTDTFDLLYLDGPKGHYLSHLQAIEPQLTADATVIADNVLFRGYVEGRVRVPRRMRTIAARMQAFLAYVGDDTRYRTTIYHTGDGLSVSKRKGT